MKEPKFGLPMNDSCYFINDLGYCVRLSVRGIKPHMHDGIISYTYLLHDGTDVSIDEDRLYKTQEECLDVMLKVTNA